MPQVGKKQLQYTHCPMLWEIKAITIKLGQLKEYYVRYIFLEKSYTQTVVENLFPDSFLENWNRDYLWINILKFYTIGFCCIPSWRLSKFIEAKLQTISILVSFSVWLLMKSIDILLNDQVMLS